MKLTSLRPIVALVAGLLLSQPFAARSADFLRLFFDTWHYNDSGVDQGTAWRDPNFDDTGWGFNFSEFGFGDGGEDTLLQSNPNGAPLNTAYFRSTFNVANPADYANLSLFLVRDDGAVVYLNGVEVFRNNMPAGGITYATKAVRNIEGDEEFEFAIHVVPASALVAGVNVLAVEIHQAIGGDEDMSFNMFVFGFHPDENQPPSAFDSIQAVDRNLSANITLQATDPDNDPLQYTLVSSPQHGTLTGTAPNLIYTPATDYTGPDSFSFMATDGDWDTGVAEVSIEVRANRPPTADAQAVTGAEDGALPITLTGSDPDANPLTFSFTQPSHGTLTGDANGNVLYTPSANYYGADSFTFTVNDGNGATASALVSITVTSVNDSPTADEQTVSVNEDTPIGILVTAADTEGDALTYSYTQPAHGSVTSSGSTAVYQSAPNYNGPDSFTFTVDDGNGGTATATITLDVVSVNDLPVALASAASASDPTNLTQHLVLVATNNQDALVILNGTGSSDVDGSLTYAWYEGASATPFSTQANPTVSLPVGTYAITLVVSDGTATASDTITVVVFTPCSAVKQLVANVQAADLKPGEKNGLLGHLNAACSTFANGNVGAAVHQLELFKERVTAKVTPGNPSLAAALNAIAQDIINDVMGQ
jgi:hypothetical protein